MASRSLPPLAAWAASHGGASGGSAAQDAPPPLVPATQQGEPMPARERFAAYLQVSRRPGRSVALPLPSHACAPCPLAPGSDARNRGRSTPAGGGRPLGAPQLAALPPWRCVRPSCAPRRLWASSQRAATTTVAWASAELPVRSASAPLAHTAAVQHAGACRSRGARAPSQPWSCSTPLGLGLLRQQLQLARRRGQRAAQMRAGHPQALCALRTPGGGPQPLLRWRAMLAVAASRQQRHMQLCRRSRKRVRHPAGSHHSWWQWRRRQLTRCGTALPANTCSLQWRACQGVRSTAMMQLPYGGPAAQAMVHASN
jgi:hypothetical protein